MSLSLEDILKVMPGFTRTRQIKVLKLLGHSEDLASSTMLTPGETLFFWVAQLLFHRLPIDQDAQDLILEKFKDTLVDYGNQLAEAIEKTPRQTPVGNLILSDRRYVVVSGKDAFLDLREAKFVDHVNLLPLEIMTYNLAALYGRNTIQLKRLAGRPKQPERECKQEP